MNKKEYLDIANEYINEANDVYSKIAKREKTTIDELVAGMQKKVDVLYSKAMKGDKRSLLDLQGILRTLEDMVKQL